VQVGAVVSWGLHYLLRLLVVSVVVVEVVVVSVLVLYPISSHPCDDY
jgi:hypothetical protein